MSTATNYKSLQYISDQPTQPCRNMAAELMMTKTLTKKTFKKLCDEILKTANRHFPGEVSALYEEILNANEMLKSGAVPKTPRLDTPLMQLMWGAAIGTVQMDKNVSMTWPKVVRDVEFTESRIWQQFTSREERPKEIKDFLRNHALEIANSVGRSGTRIGWSIPQGGYPAVGFSYEPGRNFIHTDLVWSLICGLEHSSTIIMHEIAHGMGTVSLGDKIDALRDQMIEMQKQPGARDENDYIEMKKLELEHQMRFIIFDEAENNYANRFAVNSGAYSMQDHGVSVNNFETTLLHDMHVAHAKRMQSKGKPTTGELVTYLKFAIRNAFYSNNDYFPNTSEGWKSIGINVDWLKARSPEGDGTFITGQAALRDLLENCKKLEELQLQPSVLRTHGASVYREQLIQSSKQRAAVIEDMFDRYMAHLMPEMQKQQEEELRKMIAKVRKALKRMADKQAGKDPGPPGDGDEIEITFGPGGIKIDDCPIPGATPGEIRDGKDGKGGEKGEDEGQDGKDKKKDNEKKKDDGSESLDDLVNDAMEHLPHGSGRGGKSGGGGAPANEEAAGIMLADINEYHEILAPHTATRRKVRAMLREIKRKQITEVETRGGYSLTPPDGDLSRLDVDSVTERLQKESLGIPLSFPNDYEHYHEEQQVRTVPPPIDLGILIDVSGSMEGAPLENALAISSILYEEAKSEGFNVYITAMGQPMPTVIAKPGDRTSSIGRAIAGIRETQGGGQDFLVPAMQETLGLIAAGKHDSKFLVGKTHLFVISDTAHNDQRRGVEILKALGEQAPNVTIDFCALTVDREALGAAGKHMPPTMAPDIKKFAAEVNRPGRNRNIDIVNISNAEEMHEKLLELLKRRANTSISRGIPFVEKKRELEGLIGRAGLSACTAR